MWFNACVIEQSIDCLPTLSSDAFRETIATKKTKLAVLHVDGSASVLSHRQKQKSTENDKIR